MTLKKTARRLLSACLLTLLSMHASAQDFPNKPVKIIATFPPGGGADLTARVIGQRLAEIWKQPVLVENRPGAGGNVGADAVFHSPADGYSLLLVSSSHVGNAVLLDKVTFDLLKDFAPIMMTTSSPIVIAVNPRVKANNIKDFTGLLRAQPGKIDYASCGIATTHHFAMELFKFETKTSAQHIPHRCASAVTDAVGGQLDVIAVTLPPALPFIRQGRLRALAVTSQQRSPNAPDIPTVRESGVPELKDYAVENYYGFIAPANTPKNVLAKIENDLRTVMAETELQKKLSGAGLDVFLRSSTESATLLRSDVELYRRVAKIAGIKQE
jgi:tripartite-type tricarboxylate transporter receptor subunit TctC